ncbi:MAG: hypothetical protein LBR13_07030, partial [Dysgonamonadaceae bacterium]|nr:hypothetical protein [Dysgonamonadaceae bacterium]
ALRRQIGDMKRFLEQFDFVRMRPLDAALTRDILPADCKAYILANDYHTFAGYCIGRVRRLNFPLPDGKYQLILLNPKSGVMKSAEFVHSGGVYTLQIPDEFHRYDELSVGIIYSPN